MDRLDIEQVGAAQVSSGVQKKHREPADLVQPAVPAALAGWGQSNAEDRQCVSCVFELYERYLLAVSPKSSGPSPAKGSSGRGGQVALLQTSENSGICASESFEYSSTSGWFVGSMGIASALFDR